jgi:adhesin transport system membrane fusion protein
MAYIRNSILLFIIVVFTVFAIWWSNTVQLDEFSRMQGKIIPSTKEKVIQSEFSGRLISLNVIVGQYVLEGAVLAKVQDEELLTDLEIKNEEVKRAEAALMRTAALQKKELPKFDDEWMSNWKQIALEQLIVAETRLTTLRTEKNLLASELRQVKQQIIDTRSELQAVHKSFDLVKQEEEIMKPMVERGYEPKLKLIQLKQKIEDTLSRKERLYNELDLLDLQVNEVKERESSIMATFLEQLAVDVETYSTKLNRASNELKKIKRRVNAAEIKSPVTGYISRVDVTTPGEVISTGMVLATILPESDELVIEAKLAPKDVNFIQMGQKANIIITAYDATIYGKIIGEVSTIGINTLLDEMTGETYYPITIVAKDKTFDQRPDEVAQFVPGMEASVELVGEKRSIAEYIVKPFRKFQMEAFRER